MTAADPGKPTLELEDCVSNRPGHSDHLLAEKGFCQAQAYRRLRTAGWVYQQPEQGTIALNRGYSAAEQLHFAATAAL